MLANYTSLFMWKRDAQTPISIEISAFLVQNTQPVCKLWHPIIEFWSTSQDYQIIVSVTLEGVLLQKNQYKGISVDKKKIFGPKKPEKAN